MSLVRIVYKVASETTKIKRMFALQQKGLHRENEDGEGVVFELFAQEQLGKSRKQVMPLLLKALSGTNKT